MEGTAGPLALFPVEGMSDIHKQVVLFLAEGPSQCLLNDIMSPSIAGHFKS
jgi:hypothetical protein